MRGNRDVYTPEKPEKGLSFLHPLTLPPLPPAPAEVRKRLLPAPAYRMLTQGLGCQAQVPARPPREATASSREARRCRPGPVLPSGSGTLGTALRAGSGDLNWSQDSPGRGRGGLPPPAHCLGHSLRPTPAGSPRVSSGAASTSSCKGNASGGCRALSSPPTVSPHLARPPSAPLPKRELPRLQPLPHVPQPIHGRRKLGTPRISRLEGDAGRQPMGTLGSV